MGKFPGRLYAAVIDGWFLAWPPCHDKSKNDLVLRKNEKWWFYTSKQVRGSCVQNPFQWLVPASSLDCHCYKSGSPTVLNLWLRKNAPKRKNRKKRTALRNRVWLTHQGRTSPRPFFDFTGARWHGILRTEKKPCCTHKIASWRKLDSIAEGGNEYFLIRWARLFKPLSLRRIDPADAISRICCWLGHW